MSDHSGISADAMRFIAPLDRGKPMAKSFVILTSCAQIAGSTAKPASLERAKKVDG